MHAALRAPQVKFAPLNLKNVSEEGYFEGYASLFGIEDMSRDIVMPGAFRASIKKRGATGIKMLFQHDPGEPIGVWQIVREDKKGLFVRGQLLNDVARAREVLSLMRAGAIDGLSIGFKTLKGQKDRRSGVRRLHKIDLWEISIVTFPMQPDARVAAIKSHPFRKGVPTMREFERWLTRDAGLTRSQARTLSCSGLKALAAMQDAAGKGDESRRLVGVLHRAAQTFREKRGINERN